MQKKYFSALLALNFFIFLHRAIHNWRQTYNSKPDKGYFYFPSWNILFLHLNLYLYFSLNKCQDIYVLL